MATSYKLNGLAKDLNMRTKDLSEILVSGGFAPKSSSQSLNEEEFSYLMDRLSKENQTSDLNGYLAGTTYIRVETDEKREKRLAAEKAAAEKAAELAKKQAETEALAQLIKNASAGVLVNYTGITVEQDTALRNELRKAGVSYHVYKNTMTLRACEAAGYPEMAQYLNGMNALAISENDPVAPAKILKEYADKLEKFSLVAGFVDGGVIDAKKVEDLASTPSKEVLLGRLLGSIQAPLYSLARVLTAVTEKDGTEAAAE